MQKLFAVGSALILSATVLASPYTPADFMKRKVLRPLVSSDHVANAFWSDENTNFIIWIYDKPAVCPETRRGVKQVLFIVPNHRLKDGEYSHSIAEATPICLWQTVDGPPLSCATGEMLLENFEAKKEFRGEYSYKLDDGSKRAGSFRAIYCPMGG